MSVPNFNSRLAPLLTAYANHKIAEGYTEKVAFRYLAEFDRFLKQSFDTDVITEEVFKAWDNLKPDLANRTKVARHNKIRSLAIYIRNIDNATFVPDTSRIRCTSVYSPHIFTKAEIRAIISAVDNLKPDIRAPYREIIYPTIFRLLCCCGFRISEVTSLKKSDVDLKNGIIKIVNGKGGKDRLVPLHEDMAQYLRDYYLKLQDNSDWMFPTRKGHYSPKTVYNLFRELLIVCKIPHNGNGPRVHDFRHTFAVNTLEMQLSKGYSPMEILPRLATYLGHKSYRETCWYIHLTIISFPDIAQKLDKAFAGIIPIVEGCCYEEN